MKVTPRPTSHGCWRWQEAEMEIPALLRGDRRQARLFGREGPVCKQAPACRTTAALDKCRSLAQIAPDSNARREHLKLAQIYKSIGWAAQRLQGLRYTQERRACNSWLTLSPTLAPRRGSWAETEVTARAGKGHKSTLQNCEALSFFFLPQQFSSLATYEVQLRTSRADKALKFSFRRLGISIEPLLNRHVGDRAGESEGAHIFPLVLSAGQAQKAKARVLDLATTIAQVRAQALAPTHTTKSSWNWL
ncbi:hypothetical protein GWE18_39250 [Bradyrhizobium sp. CSA112]|uniref:hypothetical protein n=1 Tax=Bradyrhizobium sp. CSA112 TaxID=2699170 RepID=UPI0023B20374|nr:hypothetical protein [Bradyrhizobium sp. CSA112]MDE5458689.1 hypothetical protein [Bradyrhizobium sp. CSA112]